MDEPTDQHKVTVELSEAQELVLFEFLWRFSERETLEIRDPAEARVLWDICCVLERALGAPFRADYAALLQSAREIVRDPD